MNRTKQLEQMLPTWTKVKQIKDFIIVDWSSDEPIIENPIIKNEIEKNKNIKIIRVENEKFFYRCLAWNLASKYTKNEIILKLDADSLNLDSSWIDYLKLTKLNESIESPLILNRYFICGSNLFYKDSSGFLLVNKKDFESVKGYNENFEPIWGYDDIDLNLRLDRYLVSKFKRLEISEWTNSRRIIFFDISKFIFNIETSNQERVSKLKGRYPILENEIDKRMVDYSAINDSISKEKTDWIYKEYSTISETDSYIRLKRLK
jgi:predicted glycosyltransferase involved in capsule biosynthesis